MMKRITGMKIPKKAKYHQDQYYGENPFHGFGLTKIVLRKNFLGNFFMKSLIHCLNYDEYMRYIDLRDNKIPAKATKDLIESLALNKNIVNFDIRDNP